ncbi:MAG: hypothetical protein QM674_04975, partial [Burkholderiaceae bacterium]
MLVPTRRAGLEPPADRPFGPGEQRAAAQRSRRDQQHPLPAEAVQFGRQRFVDRALSAVHALLRGPMARVHAFSSNVRAASGLRFQNSLCYSLWLCSLTILLHRHGG